MVEPGIMPVNESLRSGNPDDDEEEEEEGVHGDRPGTGATEDEK
jgi:hypothetical protein